jgi:hypothetical protein
VIEATILPGLISTLVSVSSINQPHKGRHCIDGDTEDQHACLDL